MTSELAIVKNLSVKVFPYDFNLVLRYQMIAKRSRFAEKPVKMIIHNVMLQNSQIQHRS